MSDLPSSSNRPDLIVELTSAPVTKRFTINWTVKDFSALKDATERSGISSEKVSAQELAFGDCIDQWRLTLQPNRRLPGTGAGSPKHIGLFLERIETPASEIVHVKCDFLVPSSGWVKSFTHSLVPVQEEDLGYTCYLSHEDLFDVTKKHLIGDALTVKADVTLSMGTHKTVTDLTRIKRPSQFTSDQAKRPRRDNLQEDLSRLLESKTGSDLVLVSTDGAEFPVHRVILSARSEVFAAMLKPHTRESETGRCTVDDVDSATLKALLEFIYTGSSEAIPEMAERLLVAADKYTLLPLSELCLEHLIDGITKENAGKLLIFADKYGMERLKTAVCQFLGVSSF